MPSWAAQVDAEEAGYGIPVATTVTDNYYDSDPEPVADIGAAMEEIAFDDYEDDYDSGLLPTMSYSDSHSIAPDDSMSVAGKRDRTDNLNGAPSIAAEFADDGWGNAPVFEYSSEPKPINHKRPGQPTNCPEHGLICPKGICKFQAAIKNKARKEKENEERRKEREERFRKANERKLRRQGTLLYVTSIMTDCSSTCSLRAYR
jgi:hypothetical protein